MTATLIKRFFYFISFCGFYIKENLVANFKVALDVVTPKHHMKPGVVAVPIELQKDWQIFLLSNLISLTPGTLCLDVAPDRKTLFVHFMYMHNRYEAVREIKKLEQKVGGLSA